MKLHEVLKDVKGSTDKWFRPVSWKGCKHAYCIEDGHSYFVPSPHGGYCDMVAQVDILIGDWEIVTPDEVLDGN